MLNKARCSTSVFLSFPSKSALNLAHKLTILTPPWLNTETHTWICKSCLIRNLELCPISLVELKGYFSHPLCFCPEHLVFFFPVGSGTSPEVVCFSCKPWSGSHLIPASSRHTGELGFCHLWQYLSEYINVTFNFYI